LAADWEEDHVSSIPFEERAQTMADITLAIVARYRSLLSIEAML